MILTFLLARGSFLYSTTLANKSHIRILCGFFYKLVDAEIDRDSYSYWLVEHMPVEFLTSEQKATPGQFFAEPNEVPLACNIHLAKLILLHPSATWCPESFQYHFTVSCVRFLGGFTRRYSAPVHLGAA